MVRKVEEARRDPRINARIKRTLENWAARQPQIVGMLQIDDGKAPNIGNMFMVTTSLSLIGHDLTVPTVADVHTDRSVV
jgi:hypothetical protein